ncbi:MAG TPA: hypothetical protein ENG66_08435 [Thermococcus sp.]|nr:hypothetical protein [Thermococcus sp.]
MTSKKEKGAEAPESSEEIKEGKNKNQKEEKIWIYILSKNGTGLPPGSVFEYNEKYAKEWIEAGRARVATDQEIRTVKEARMTRTFFDKEKFMPSWLGDYIMKLYSFKTLADTDEILYYKGGVYRFGGEVVIRKECKRLLGHETKKQRVNEVIHYIKCSTYTQRDEFDSDPNLLNLKNGIFRLDRWMMEKHNPEILSLTQLPVEYDPNAKCPRIEKFFSEIVSKEDIILLKEIVGFLLLPDYRIQKAIMLHGEGANGKSTFIKLITAFLGNRNVSGIPLKDLISNRFSTAFLFGKFANVYPDIPSSELTSTGKFKALTGGDFISAEKKFKDQFEFENRAKLIFSANELPKTKDNTSAFYRRWLIVEFPNRFEGKNANQKLIDQLTTPGELSGLLNIALDSLKKIIKTGGFSRRETSQEISKRYERLSNPLSAFLEDCCLVSHDNSISKLKLYTAFKIYTKRNRLPILSETKFSMELKQKINFLSEQRKKIKIDGGETIRESHWVGISLNDEFESILLKYSETIDPLDPHDPDKKLGKTPDPIDPVDPKGQGVKGVKGSFYLNASGENFKIHHINMKEPEKEHPSKADHKKSGREFRKTIQIVQEVIRKNCSDSKDGLADKEKILDSATDKGIAHDLVEECITDLKNRGIIYEPRHGKIALVGG